MHNKKVYDLVFSLGGSCAWAFQLRCRELRLASLPFDWLFVVDDDPLRKLNVCFVDDFSHWLNRENIKLLEDNEKSPAHSAIQYKDTYTGYRLIHDFTKPVEDDETYIRIKDQYQRRIERLYDYMTRSQRICLLYDASWKVDYSLLVQLRETLLKKFGNDKVIDIVVCEFLAEKDEIVIPEKGLSVYRWTRKKNDYLFGYPAYEFSFLDSVTLSGTCPAPVGHSKWWLIGKIPPKGIKCFFLPRHDPVVRIRFSLGGKVLFDGGVGAPGK